MRFANRLIITAVVLLSIILLLAPRQTQAASISISPLRQELTLKPGESFTNKLQVANFNQSAITVKLSAQSFNITGENYDYDFATSERAQQWVSFDQSEIILQPRQVANIGYSLGVPASAEPGERYIAVFASTSSSTANSITSVDRVGLLLYVDVGGDLSRHGQVSDLSLPLINLGRQSSWSLKLHNSGSGHFHSRLTTWTQTIFGHTLNATPADHLSLPDTVRLFQGKVQTGAWPGWYKVRFSVGRGDDPAYSTTKWILYLPIWAMVGLAFLVYAVITQGPKLKHRIRQLVQRPKPTKPSQPKAKSLAQAKPKTKAVSESKSKPKTSK